jgi:hypothetical protein
MLVYMLMDRLGLVRATQCLVRELIKALFLNFVNKSFKELIKIKITKKIMK